MSKTGNAIIRDADAASLDNAYEVERLRAELAQRDQVIGNGMEQAAKLRHEVAGLAATAARLSQQVAGARAVLSPVGMVPLIDAASYLGGHDRPAMARAVDEAADAICQARAILDGA